MTDIIRIVIKSTSGYCPVEYVYQDKLTITPDSISYIYRPYLETEINPKRKWSYKTTSPIFKMKYKEIAKKISDIKNREITELMCDAGNIEFQITYDHQTKWKESYPTHGDTFKDLFKMIQSIIPDTEYIPAVILTSDCYQEE